MHGQVQQSVGGGACACHSLCLSGARERPSLLLLSVAGPGTHAGAQHVSESKGPYHNISQAKR